MKTYFISQEELQLLTDDQLDVLDAEYWYEKWKLEQEAMEIDYSFGI